MLLLYADAAAPNDAIRGFEAIATASREQAGGRLAVYAVLAPGVTERPGNVTSVRDTRGEFSSSYGADGATCLYLIRPDGYVGFRAAPAAPEPLLAYLQKIFTPRSD